MLKLVNKIAIFDQYPFLGGGQVVLLSIIEASAKIAAHVSIIVPFGGALVDVLNESNKPNVTMYEAPIFDVRHGRKKISDLLKIGLYNVWMVIKHMGVILQSDLIYANGPRQFPGLLAISWLLRKSCIYHIHIDHSSLEKKLIALAVKLKSTHRIIINSNYILNRLESDIPGIKNNPRVVVIENSLNPIMSSQNFVDRYSTHQGNLKIAVIGVMRPEKGQDCAVTLASKNQHIEIHLIGRIGSGAQTWVDNLKREAPKNVFFHGERTDIPNAIQQLGIQVVLVPSIWQEPFGLVAIEGMACSCITVVFDSGALPDIASKTGALVCKNQESLQDIIDELLAMSNSVRLGLAKSQYENTMLYYRAERFVVDIQNVLSSKPIKN